MSEPVLWVLLLLPAFVAGAVTYAVFRWAFGEAQPSASPPDEPADPSVDRGIARLVIRVPSRFPVERVPHPPAACLSRSAAIEVPND